MPARSLGPEPRADRCMGAMVGTRRQGSCSPLGQVTTTPCRRNCRGALVRAYRSQSTTLGGRPLTLLITVTTLLEILRFRRCGISISIGHGPVLIELKTLALRMCGNCPLEKGSTG